MDIVLEFVDTFIADYAYAHLFPIEHLNKTATNASGNGTMDMATGIGILTVSTI